MLWLLFLQNIDMTHFLHHVYLIHLVWNSVEGHRQNKAKWF